MATTSSTASRSPDLADDPAKLLAARLAGNLLVETPQPCRRRRSRASSYRKSPSRRPCSLPRRQNDDAELKPLPGATTTSTTKRAEPEIDADANAASWGNNAEAEQQARRARCTASLHHLTTPRLVPCLAWTFDEPFGEH